MSSGSLEQEEAHCLIKLNLLSDISLARMFSASCACLRLFFPCSYLRFLRPANNNSHMDGTEGTECLRGPEGKAPSREREESHPEGARARGADRERRRYVLLSHSRARTTIHDKPKISISPFATFNKRGR